MHGVLLVFTLAGPPRVDRDAWFAADKARHFFTAAFVQGVTYGTLRAAGASHGVSIGGATAVTTSLSVGKELYDRGGRGTPSAKDLAWDGLGAGVASVMLVRVQR